MKKTQYREFFLNLLVVVISAMLSYLLSYVQEIQSSGSAAVVGGGASTALLYAKRFLDIC